MKRKYFNILIMFIIVISCFIVSLSVYKFYLRDNKKIENEKYIISNIGEQIIFTYDINYVEQYKNNIISNVITTVEYSMAYEDNVLYGNIYIGNDKKLYISNEINNSVYLLLDKKIKTLYDSGKNSNFCSVFAITEDGELYNISLTKPLISTTSIQKINISEKVVSFTDLSLKNYFNDSTNSVVVLTEDGSMYDSLSLTKYNSNTLNVLNQYIVYEMGYIANFEGKIFVNSKGEKYKAKIIITSNTPLEYFKNTPSTIIITEDDKLIYLSENSRIFEYKKNVKIVGVNDDKTIVIVFENDEYITIDGFYNEDYYSVLDKENETIE